MDDIGCGTMILIGLAILAVGAAVLYCSWLVVVALVGPEHARYFAAAWLVLEVAQFGPSILRWRND